MTTGTDDYEYQPLAVREGWVKLEDWERRRVELNVAIRESLRTWLESRYVQGKADYSPESERMWATFALRFHEMLQSQHHVGPKMLLANVLHRCQEDQRLALEFVDFTLCALDSTPEAAHRREHLDSTFRAGLTVWRVALMGQEDGQDRYGLVQHPSEQADLAALVAASGPRHRAGVHLREAWGYLYGRSPNASHAYWHAVKARSFTPCPVIVATT